MRLSTLMTPLHWLRRNMREQPLSYRVLASTLLWSVLVTTLAVTVQLYAAWRSEVAQIERRLGEIESGYVPSLTASLWSVDRAQVELMLDGILRLPEIGGVRLIVAGEEPIVRGQIAPDDVLLARSYGLQHQGDRLFELGELQVIATRAGVVRRLHERALGIVASEAITIFLVSLFVFALFQRRINRHLRAMSAYTRQLDASRLGTPLQLDRPRASANPDEIEQVADAINRMRERLHSDIDARTRVEAELQQHRDHLEELIQERTAQLQAQTHQLERQSAELMLARDHAEQALERLQTAQQQLVESEKMASLGQLVAGVAHEVNTPLGVALTASSYQELQTQELRSELAAGALTRSSIGAFVESMSTSSELIQRNLQRAAHLVQSFKQVSVDRTSDGRRKFELNAFAEELVASLRTLWRHRSVEVSIACDSGLLMDSFPGALGSVLTNLIQNALVHAFAADAAGRIDLLIRAQGADQVLLSVSDNGAGIDADKLGKIFEPFYTTRRGQGGTGLGLHVVYNLVTQKLGGRVDVSSQRGAGSCFRVVLPRCAPIGPAQLTL